MHTVQEGILNLNIEKWEGEPINDREDYYDGEFLVREFEGKKKPLVSAVFGGRKLFTVNSRMKCYDDLMQRRYYDVRRLIVEKRDSENGSFLRVGLYF